VLVEDVVTCFAGIALYGFAGWAYWQAGVEQAGFCLDAEMVRAPRVRAADGATMLIVFALGVRALLGVGKMIADGGVPDSAAQRMMLALQAGLLALIGAAAVLYLRRRPRAIASRRLVSSLLLGVAAGGCVGALLRAAAGPGVALPPEAIVSASMLVLVQELVLRGVVQRAMQEHYAARAARVNWRERFGGAAVSFAAGVVATALWLAPTALRAPGPTAFAALAALALVQAAAAVVYAATGRVAISIIAHAVIVGVAAFA
jgi:hypothetical protein